ncbi:MAG: hypothetical protein ACUVRU_04630, partial [Anaerolineae bacterium]
MRSQPGSKYLRARRDEAGSCVQFARDFSLRVVGGEADGQGLSLRRPETGRQEWGQQAPLLA